MLKSITVERLGAHLGAEIKGIDLTQPVDDAGIKMIGDALVEHQVLVLRDQQIDIDQFMAFGRHFGELTVHPFRGHQAGANKLSSTNQPEYPELIILYNDGDNPPHSTDQWHSDEMFRVTPPSATVLRGTITPKIGGDTVFASMTAAHDGLDPTLQHFYSSLEAVHDFKVFRSFYSDSHEGRQKLVDLEQSFPNTTHPVVRVHPVSGRKAIFVSPQTTKFIAGLRDFESEHILQMLYRLPEIPEYQFRVKWEPNTIIVWDNRSTQHYAPRDYLPQRRRMERVTVQGDRPFGEQTPPGERHG